MPRPTEFDAPPIVEELAPPITLAIAHPATEYDEDLPIDTRADTVSAGDRRPLHDHRLDAAAAELLDAVHQGAALTPTLVEFVTHAHGVVEPPKLYMTEPPADVLGPPNTRVGIAGDLTLVIHTGPVRFTALPRAIKGSFEMHATLAAPYTHPRLTVTGDDRAVEHPTVTVDGTAFRASITCVGTTSWIEVEADNAPGPLAVVPVACGTAQDTIRAEPERNVRAADPERRLTALINRERIAAHLPPVRSDRRTTAAAASYARVMMRASETAHNLARVPLTRIADAGRRPVFVDETTFRAPDLAEASLQLLNDRTYRAQLLAKNATHVGIGVAQSSAGELFVAIDYIQILPIIDTAALETRVARQIIDRNNTRRSLRPSGPRRPPRYADFLAESKQRRINYEQFIVAPPLVDDELRERARYYASMLATGWSASTIDINMNRALVGPRSRFGRVEMERIEITDPATVDESKRFADGAIVDAIGVGVAQSGRDGWLSGRIYLVILYARY